MEGSINAINLLSNSNVGKNNLLCLLYRIQTMKMVNGKPRYTGLFDVWVKTVQKEGVLGLWKGFSPYYMRMGPHTTLLLVFTEQFTYLYSVHILHNKASYGL